VSQRLLCVCALTLLACAWPAGASSDATGFAVSAWPSRVVVSAPGTTTVAVGNPGDEPVGLVARPAGYALDRRGRPRVEPATGTWFAVRPARLLVAPRGTAQLRITVRRPREARPGDHAQLLLLSTEPPPGRRVAARLRIGVVVVVRVPGRRIRRLALGRLAVQRHARFTVVEVTVANRGNVDEWLGRGRISVTLIRQGWRMASAAIEPRRLLARSSGVVEAWFRGRRKGRVSAVVVVLQPRAGAAVARRSYLLRL
jgi:hypothetical protein